MLVDPMTKGLPATLYNSHVEHIRLLELINVCLLHSFLIMYVRLFNNNIKKKFFNIKFINNIKFFLIDYP